MQGDANEPLLPRLGLRRIVLVSLNSIFEGGMNFPNRVVWDHAKDGIEFDVGEIARWILTHPGTSSYTLSDVYVPIGRWGVSDFGYWGAFG